MTASNPAIRKNTWRLLLATLGMFGFGFAMVPFYDVFCDWTGINGRTSTEAESADTVYAVDETRTVTVAFIASVNETLPWDFKPEVVQMQVHPGQAYTTRFYAKNRNPGAMVGHAVPSVAPGIAAKHFKKTECFCFTEQRFEGGEGRWMPVRFVVDPELPGEIKELALSYTFFDTGNVVATKPEFEPLEAVVPAK